MLYGARLPRHPVRQLLAWHWEGHCFLYSTQLDVRSTLTPQHLYLTEVGNETTNRRAKRGGHSVSHELVQTTVQHPTRQICLEHIRGLVKRQYTAPSKRRVRGHVWSWGKRRFGTTSFARSCCPCVTRLRPGMSMVPVHGRDVGKKQFG